MVLAIKTVDGPYLRPPPPLLREVALPEAARPVEAPLFAEAEPAAIISRLFQPIA